MRHTAGVGVGGLNGSAPGHGALQRIAWLPGQLVRLASIGHHNDVGETVHIPRENSLGEERRRRGAEVNPPGSELLEVKAPKRTFDVRTSNCVKQRGEFFV